MSIITESRVLTVFGSDARSLAPLEEACRNLKLIFFNAHNEEEFQETIATGKVSCIIVPFTSDEIGENTVCEFTNMAYQVLQPEDADVRIIYSSEGYTPGDWPWPKADPRPVTNYEDIAVQTFFHDVCWKHSIEEITTSHKNRFSYERNKTGLKIDIDRACDVPFPSEAVYLLRAAFKDMSRISVKFSDQGFSGSIACFINTFDSAGKKCKELFAKIYNDHDKALQEFNNALEYVDKYNIDYPRHQHYRRYQGVGYSLMVTECTKGPNNMVWTFLDLITTEKMPVKGIKNFLNDLLSHLNKWPIMSKKIDLVDSYLLKLFPKEDLRETDLKKMLRKDAVRPDPILSKLLEAASKRRKLGSANRCHRWFGQLTDGLSLESKIRKFFLKMGLEGTVAGICHGDLHLDNILVKAEKNKLGSGLIDFSHTGWSHSIKDCVTIETDLIIRGLDGVKAFRDTKVFASFLDALVSKGKASRYIRKIKMNNKELLRSKKVILVIETIRSHASSKHKVSALEYFGAALLKTLEVLSYAKLPFDQNERATTYVTYLLERLKAAS